MPEAETGRLSPWRDAGAITDQQAREHAARLELRAGAESEIAIREEYVGLLGDSGRSSLGHRIVPSRGCSLSWNHERE